MTDDGIRGFLVEKGTNGFAAPEIDKQVLAARLDHWRDLPRQRRRARANLLPGVTGPQGAALPA